MVPSSVVLINLFLFVYASNGYVMVENSQPPSLSPSWQPSRHPYADTIYPLTAGWEQATATGARYGGVSKSEYRVSSDVWRLEKVKSKIVAAGRLTGIDPAILAAIASRGSAAGYQLNSRGYSYHSTTKYGYMQLSTTRYYVDTSGGPSGQAHFDQAAKVLKSALEYVEDSRPYWQKAMQVKAGIAAYDVGVQNYIIPSTIAIDTETTDKDYSNDVLARAKYLRRKRIF